MSARTALLEAWPDQFTPALVAASVAVGCQSLGLREETGQTQSDLQAGS